jgi:pyrrolidone-carboxylate peptidase
MQKLTLRSFNRDYVKFKDKINPSEEYIETMKNSVVTENQIKMKVLASAHSILDRVVKEAEKVKRKWN